MSRTPESDTYEIVSHAARLTPAGPVFDRDTFGRQIGFNGFTNRASEISTEMRTYGVLTREGANLRLSELAIEAVTAQSPDALRRVAMEPQPFRDLWRAINSGEELPADDIPASFRVASLISGFLSVDGEWNGPNIREAVQSGFVVKPSTTPSVPENRDETQAPSTLRPVRMELGVFAGGALRVDLDPGATKNRAFDLLATTFRRRGGAQPFRIRAFGCQIQLLSALSEEDSTFALDQLFDLVTSLGSIEVAT